ncbi:MAG TPA: hypothetical protein PLX35_10700 [Cyclobacteriaceae bacterium]|nr:hypothetical protein [Cyclobacteriaceae bacterium]
MRRCLLLVLVFALGSCGSQTYHTVKVIKPIYHHTWYKNSRWHKRIQVGRMRVRLFEKQGARPVKMKG